MTRAIIITSAFLPDISFKNSDVIGVEKGAQHCLKSNIKMVFAIADFDSTSTTALNQIKKKVKTIVLEKEKNETDLEAAIIKARESGYKEIICCTSGMRLDHMLNQVQLAIKYNVTVYTPGNKISYIGNQKTINKDGYKYISFFAGKKAKFTAKGVKYPIANSKINFEATQYVSNEILKSFADVSSRLGDVVAIQSNDK